MNEYRWLWKNNPIHWWVVMLCMAFIWLVLVMVLAGVQGSSGTYTQTVTTNNIYTDQETPHTTRGPNNGLYYVFIQPDGLGLSVDFSSNSGGSWTEYEIVDAAWKGHSYIQIGGVQVSSNSTCVVYFNTLDADSTYDSYLAVRWGWSGSWVITNIWSSVTYSMSFPKMAINDTDMILLTCFYNGALRYKTYDLDTDTVDPLISPILWLSETNAWDYGITVNVSGKFILSAKTWSGSFMRYYTRDLEKIHATIYLQMWSSVIIPWMVGFECTDDDLFVIGIAFNHLTAYSLQHYYQSTPWSGFIRIPVMPIGATTKFGYYTGCSMSVTQGDTVYYYVHYDTDVGGDGDIDMFHAQYDSVEGVWQGSQETIYSATSQDDVIYGTGFYTGLFPYIDGKYANLPISGWCRAMVWRDEQGATDDYYSQIQWNCTWDSFIFSDPPEIITATIPDGTVDVAYSTIIHATDGELPYSWSLVTAPFWLEINSVTGVLSGTPPATGNYTVRVRVTDDVSRTDDEIYTLTIKRQPPTGRSLDFPIPTIETVVGALWWIFMVMAMLIAVLDVIMKVRKKVDSGGQV